jgi:membrane peptidoglycan carboxypeptidase
MPILARNPVRADHNAHLSAPVTEDMGLRPGFPAPVSSIRGPLVTIAVLVAIAAPIAATLWFSTPDVSDVRAREARDVQSKGVVLLRPDQVPKTLAEAVVATEDERFYSHHGIDTIGLARAALYDIANRCLCQGGSTITEQLVKELYLNGSDRGYDKVVDMVLALKVEGMLSKPEIMAYYLSEIPTGLNRHGVTAAACAYFHAPLDSLDLAQYALLAGVTQAPSLYDPTVDPAAAASRRGQVLADMVSESFVSREQAAAAGREPVLADPPSPAC